MSDANAAGDGAGDAAPVFDAKLEEEQVQFSSSSDESEAAEAFPREVCKKLRAQVRALSTENCQLRRSVEQLRQHASAPATAPSSRGSKKPEPPRLASEVAAAQVSELSRRLRDMCAELEATRNKQRVAEEKVVSLTAELERLRSAPPPAAAPPATEGEGAPSPEEQVRQLTERLSAANAKLCDSRSQCAQVRRELQLAQRALANEVGEAVAVSQLGSFRGRAQQILQLQRRVAELQDRLAQHQLQTGQSQPAASSSDHGVSPAQAQLLQQMEKERRAAHEQTVVALRDTQLQLEDSRRRLEGQRARTKVLEAELRDLKQKMQVLLEKGEHDNQLVAALTSQLQSAEEAAQDKRTLLTVESERLRERARQLEDELTALRGQLATQAAQLAQKDRLAEQLQLRLDQLDQPKLEGSVCDSPRSAASEYSGGFQPALQAAEAERRRLLELVAVLHTRLDEREQAAAHADQRWRQERARAAQLQTKVERLEVERQSLVKVGCYRGPANKQLQQQLLSIEERQQLELLQEEVALLRTRLDVLRREKDDDRAKYLSLLQRSWDQEQHRSEAAPSSSYCRSPSTQRRGSVQQSCASSVAQQSLSSRSSGSLSGGGSGAGVNSSRASRCSGAPRRARSQAPTAR